MDLKMIFKENSGYKAFKDALNFKFSWFNSQMTVEQKG